MVELIVSDILSKTSDDRAYVMILRERDGNRKILVAIGYGEAQAVAFALKGVETKRPVLTTSSVILPRLLEQQCSASQ